MRITVVLKTALMALMKNKMRSFLTALGIIIGVGAVISMVSMGTGAKYAVEQQMSTLGRNVLMVIPGADWHSGRRTAAGSRTSLNADDVNALAKEASALAMIAPTVRTNAQVVYGNMNWITSVYGVTSDYFKIREWELEKGEMFTAKDNNGSTKICIMGQEVASNLFGDEDPIGKTIRVNKIPFKVIGLLIKRGQSMGGSNQDDVMFIPMTTAQKRIMGITHVNMAYASAKTPELMETAKTQIEEILRRRHKIRPGRDDDFFVRNSADLIEAGNAITTALTLLLGGIASVSLIVGGIGIMNIMLVSVVERTREIGIRMAVGGRARDILRQFLIEAVVLSLVGGMLGIGLGAGLTVIIAKVANWPTAISAFSVILAFLFSAAIGTFFGYYPAYKASRLDPIEALRYE